MAWRDLAVLGKYIKRDPVTVLFISTNFSPGSVFFVLAWLLRTRVYQGRKCILSSARCLQLCKPAGKRWDHELLLLLHMFI